MIILLDYLSARTFIYQVIILIVIRLTMITCLQSPYSSNPAVIATLGTHTHQS